MTKKVRFKSSLTITGWFETEVADYGVKNLSAKQLLSSEIDNLEYIAEILTEAGGFSDDDGCVKTEVKTSVTDIEFFEE
jgi:hypothetical protein